MLCPGGGGSGKGWGFNTLGCPQGVDFDTALIHLWVRTFDSTVPDGYG